MDAYVYSTAEVAAKLGCSPRTVCQRAKALGVGINLGGSAGMRFAAVDVERIIEAARPATPVPARRRRRRRGIGA
jgi:hypothetical protein